MTNISNMGFPAPRVARAVQRLGDKDREVSTSFPVDRNAVIPAVGVD